jgi:hypothetical protein
MTLYFFCLVKVLLSFADKSFKRPKLMVTKMRTQNTVIANSIQDVVASENSIVGSGPGSASSKPSFQAGDQVLLRFADPNDPPGTFVAFRFDKLWADISDCNGAVTPRLVQWLRHYPDVSVRL